MTHWQQESMPVFELFRKQWALVTAGTPDHFNACTVSWGSLGTIWQVGSVVTVYIHPARHTWEFLKAHDTFTLSFFPPECRPALSYMGAHSGRDGDKEAAAGLTPVEMEGGVTYTEANLTFLCRKICQQPFAKDALAPDVQDAYASHPSVYPAQDESGWQPHWMFIGEILGVEDQR